MRTEDVSLIGRDHLSYRGYHVPVKGVIDGDLCERYRLLPNDKKQAIASELDHSVREVERKISVRHLLFTFSPLWLVLYPANDIPNRMFGLCLPSNRQVPQPL